MTLRVRTIGFGLAVATVLALFMFTPVDSDSTINSAPFFGIQDACAQTGTCNWSPNDICFVSGMGYNNREWQGR